MKRKREQKDALTKCLPPTAPKCVVQGDLLEQQYGSVLSLRQYILKKLPRTSKIRRRIFINLGRQVDQGSNGNQELSRLLDSALVCGHVDEPGNEHDPDKEVRFEQWISFSQKPDDSAIPSSGGVQAASFKQSEIVDFIVWLLFSQAVGERPKHLLCDGFHRTAVEDKAVISFIPGIYCRFPNSQFKALKQDPWPELLFLLGQSGESIMIDLLVDHNIFVPIEAGFGNFYQFSGFPLSETPHGLSDTKALRRKPSEIVLVRSRIFYGQALLSAKGQVVAGFRRIHVLNHCPPTAVPHPEKERDHSRTTDNTTRLMMYMFPRQYKLHNVFTSRTDTKMTTQKLHDYTSREEEIKALSGKGKRPIKTPKRLRIAVRALVEKLQNQHKKCSYTELLSHYCPVKPYNVGTGDVTDVCTPVEHVSAFCQAVISYLIPREFFGEAAVSKHNLAQACSKIDDFVKLRKFEGMSLQRIVEGFKIVDIPWLQGTPKSPANQKTSMSDYEKRREIFYEFLFWLFDSLLIPLLRANFYITESSTDRMEVFYFRYETWRLVAVPSIRELGKTLLEEVPTEDAEQVLSARDLGYSQLRLLPKGATLRPIMNLKRRLVGSKKQLLQSINTLLGPVHKALQYEKIHRPLMLGKTMFSVSDIYESLKSFKRRVALPNHLYFAKVDVKAAFDTIPQAAAVDLMQQIFAEPEYYVRKHVEIKPAHHGRDSKQKPGKMIKSWHQTATTKPRRGFQGQFLTEMAHKKKNTVFIGDARSWYHSRRDLSALVTEHVAQNLVKVGKKYYRQKRGIPQGSVLSNFLCNYFYADLEAQHLSFLSDDSLLMRLTDDFLLITPHKSQAEKFVHTMLPGLPDYGVEVGPSKTLVNFDVKTEGGDPVTKLPDGAWFPYCGSVIDCATLDVAKDPERRVISDISFSMTVEHSRAPGRNFQAKSLNFFKVQAHMMYFDTSHNSIRTVLETLEEAFKETARKMVAYYRSLPKKKQPAPAIVTRTISEIVEAAHRLLTGESRSLRYPKYKCELSRSQVVQTASAAFITILGKKQTGFREVHEFLQRGIASRR